MTEIILENLGKRFGDFTALSGMNLTIGNGEFLALLGPSGCGKSTTMNMIAGMLDPCEGEIRFNGRSMNGVRMAKRGVGFVFQNYAIFTHMTVFDNLAYGLRAQGLARAETKRRVGEIAELLQLSDLLDRKAAGLSVNILQRLAIGRSAVVEPSIFLLDEPLSNVDAAFRAVMRSELKSLQRQFKQTMVYVTHDQLEAMTMADRIAVMDHGKLLQVGTPLDVYNHPADTFVAQFIGAPGMNLLPARVSGSDSGMMADLGAAGGCPLPSVAPGGPVIFGFRPEEVTVDPSGPMQMQITFVERIGARIILHLAAGDHTAKAVLEAGTAVPEQGETFRFSVPTGSVRLFDAQTERAL